jgi:hypothetical protein
MKPFLSAFLIAIMVGGFALAGTLQLGVVKADTNVTGIIDSDTTWTKSNSPYNLTGNVLVDSGVTLTVEADTTLNFNDHYIRVNGSLTIQPGVTVNFGSTGGAIQVNGVMTARGTSTNPIHINGGSRSWSMWIAAYSTITFSESSAGWNEQTGSGCIIENAIISSTTIETSGSMKFSSNIMEGSEILIKDGSPEISNNFLTSSIQIEGGSPTVSDNEITGGSISLFHGNSVTITGNIIAQSTGGDSAGIRIESVDMMSVLIERNLIAYCFQGINMFYFGVAGSLTSLTIQDNTIINNQNGITITNRYVPTISNNNIFNNNVNVELSNKASNDINATYNWWGTTDTSTIDSLIYDFNDDFNLGKVNYTPFLTALNPSAPDPNTPIATPMPVSTPSPSPTATSSPPQTSTPTPSQEPQQTELTTIIGAAIAVAVLGAGLGLLIYLIKRK